MIEPLLLLTLGTLVGLIGTLIGVGGGFILIPILAFAYPHVPPSGVVAISFFVVMANALSGTIAYARATPVRIAYNHAWIYALATVPGSVLGSIVKGRLDRPTFMLILGCVMILGGTLLLVVGGRAGLARRDAARKARQAALGADASAPSASGAPPLRAGPVSVGVLISLVVGFVASLVGIGGGIIHVPALVFVLDFPVHAATATSHFVLAVTAIAGNAHNIGAGELQGHWLIAGSLAIGAMAGAQIGAVLSKRTPPSWIIRGLGVAVLLVAARVLYESSVNR
jgi:uncharacterized membrane protein YfcA